MGISVNLVKLLTAGCRTYGQLIVFEGIDGSGKSTCCDSIFRQLTVKGFDPVKFVEPSNGIFGRQIREAAAVGELPSSSELADLFIKDRLENRDKNLLPALEAGKIVLLDRYFHSSVAYQGVELSPEYVLELNQDVILNPDLVFMFDIDVETALARIEKHRGKTTGFEKKEYLQQVKAIYDSFFKSSNIRRIDARRDLGLVCADVHTIVINFLSERKDIHECTGKASNSRADGVSV